MRRRLILGATYLLVVVIVALAVPFGQALSRRLTDELGGRVEREAYAVAAAVEDRLERGDVAALQPLIESVGRRIGGRIVVTDARGSVLADSQGPVSVPAPSYASRPEIARALGGVAGWEVRTSRSLGYDLVVSAVPVASAGRTLGAVRVSFPMGDVRAAIRRSWAFLALVGLAALVLGLVLAAWLARSISRPLGRAATVARRVAGGDLEARVPEEGPPEVRQLAHDMNEMNDRLQDKLRAEREFAANASHQLRTPLAALRLSLEEVIDGPDPRGEASRALEQVDRLSAVVAALLRMGAARERPGTSVDVAAVARSVAASLPPAGPTVEVSGEGLALADEERVREVLANLLDNARRYARRRIRVEIDGAHDRTIARVDDDGPGVDRADLSRVFDRFYRAPEAVGPGSGLGLAVARDLVEVDGGTIRASESPMGGARFEVSWPARPRAVDDAAPEDGRVMAKRGTATGRRAPGKASP
jgi:signal transduction histidine kinase